MSGRWSKFALLFVVGFFVAACRNSEAASNPLPSWNDGAVKRGILEFVDATTHQGASRLRATGGTNRHLRQRRHAVGRAARSTPVRLRRRPAAVMAPNHPEWKDEGRTRAILSGDRGAMAQLSMRGFREGRRGDPQRDDRRRVPCRSQGLARRPRSTRGSIAPTPTSSTSRCSSLWDTCAPKATRPTS